MREVYVNGQFTTEDKASVSIFDRGFLFADSIYEVVSVLNAKLVDFDAHQIRLERSLNEIGIKASLGSNEILAIHRELIKRNHLIEGLVYFQMTRGVADRDFVFPGSAVSPTTIAFTQAKPLVDSAQSKAGISVVTEQDLRWQRCDIKTTQLLFSSWIKNIAIKRNADDAWLVRDGLITEGTASNAYIIKDGRIITRGISSLLLAGITRKSVLQQLNHANIVLEERAFTVEEAINADEAFMTGSAALVTPVVSIDGVKLGDGQPGLITKKVRELYVAAARASLT